MYRRLLLIATITAVMASCSNGGRSGNEKDSVDTVKVETLRKGNFDEPFIVQGKIKASQYADVAFTVTLPIEAVYVRNGQAVAKGQTIAKLDMFKQQNTIEQARKTVEQAKLNMEDVIISQGYDPDKPLSIPAEVRRLAEVKSGYSIAVNQQKAAEHELTQCVVTAPFSGVVAQLSIQPHTIAQAGVPICRIIAQDKMEVEFKVMEADLGMVKVGTIVGVTPIATRSKTYDARVMDINPLVDENGTVSIRAMLKGDKDLFDGMNVEVGFERHIEGVTIVPKRAIVIRNGHQVVFVADKGIARQFRVSPRQEAKGQCVIETEEEMPQDCKLIIEGNETLTEGEQIAVKE
ncbi:MAG: efflux RND transporter periplasmic adaptor subunit [Prevotella sp.]